MSAAWELLINANWANANTNSRYKRKIIGTLPPPVWNSQAGRLWQFERHGKIGFPPAVKRIY
jgi:hypothetical protein